MSMIKTSNTKRFRTRERQQTEDILSVCSSYQVTACVCGRSLLSPRSWLKLTWPTLLLRGTQTPTIPLSSSVSDMHFGNLSAPSPLPDMNSVIALSLYTSTHTLPHSLRTVLPCNYSRLPPPMYMHTLTCTVVYIGLFFSSGSHVWVCPDYWQPHGKPPCCVLFPPLAIYFILKE